MDLGSTRRPQGVGIRGSGRVAEVGACSPAGGDACVAASMQPLEEGRSRWGGRATRALLEGPEDQEDPEEEQAVPLPLRRMALLGRLPWVC